MRKASAYFGIFFCLLGTAVLVSSIFLLTSFQHYYQVNEVYFQPPIYLKSPSLTIRQDAYGKGYFGAPRDGKRTHKGIDILARVNEPILAAKSGRVVFAGQGKGYGFYVQILHPDGLTTLYAHLTHYYVKAGDWVVTASVIGTCGKTGNASNPRMKPHVHFEIQTSSGALNPGAGLLNPSIAIRRP